MTESANFPPGCPSNDKCRVCKIRTEKATNWPGKIKNFPWEAKFSLGKRKKSTGSGFTGSVREGCCRRGKL